MNISLNVRYLNIKTSILYQLFDYLKKYFQTFF